MATDKSTASPDVNAQTKALWQFLRDHGVVRINVVDGQARLLEREGKVRDLKALIRPIQDDIVARKRENRITVMDRWNGLVEAESFAGLPARRPTRTKEVVKDQEVERTLDKELQRLREIAGDLWRLFSRVVNGFETIPSDLSLAESPPAGKAKRKKKWKGTKLEFAAMVKDEYQEDLKVDVGKRNFRGKADAARKLFAQYEFPEDMNWCAEKCSGLIYKV